jgi:hypothetical protein
VADDGDGLLEGLLTFVLKYRLRWKDAAGLNHSV